MSQENVDAFKRGIEAYNRRDIEASAGTPPPVGCVAELKSGNPILMRTYLDPKEALEAAGLRE